MSDTVYDFVGIGVGPFNLGLACLTQPLDDLNGLFLDQSEGFDWHPGMLLPEATLQTPFLADLVTLADPTSPYSFLNYLKSQGRIYAFYIRENFFLLRREYNQYCQWVAGQLPNLVFNTQVRQVEYDERERCYRIEAICTRSGRHKTYRAKKLVLGTGPAPHVPSCCRPLMERAVHSSAYLSQKSRLQAKRSITVLGSGQSAAEIYYDLLQDIDRYGYELSWITRSPRFFPLEYSKLTLEMTSPEYVDYFHNLPAHQRDELAQSQKNLYKGISTDLINAIYDLLYTKNLSDDIQVNLHTNAELRQARFRQEGGRFELSLFQHQQEKHYHHHTEGLVLATGYAYQLPDFIEGIASRIRWDGAGRFDVRRDYSIDRQGSEIYVQNAELHTHGFVTPDLGMACYRNAHIIRSITGREHYPVERSIAFQQFAAPEARVPQPAPEPV